MSSRRTAAELLALPDVDGALVGGASLDAESFAAIVKAAVLMALVVARSHASYPRLLSAVVLDGWGLAPDGPGNAVSLASTPCSTSCGLRIRTRS